MDLPPFVRFFTFALLPVALFVSAAVALADAASQPGVPHEELVRDWIMQDYGLDVEKCFASDSSSGVEQKMVVRVLEELGD